MAVWYELTCYNTKVVDKTQKISKGAASEKQTHCPIMIFLESCANSGSMQSVALKNLFNIIS